MELLDQIGYFYMNEWQLENDKDEIAIIEKEKQAMDKARDTKLQKRKERRLKAVGEEEAEYADESSDLDDESTDDIAPAMIEDEDDDEITLEDSDSDDDDSDEDDSIIIYGAPIQDFLNILWTKSESDYLKVVEAAKEHYPPHKAVNRFINGFETKDKTKSKPKIKQILTNAYKKYPELKVLTKASAQKGGRKRLTGKRRKRSRKRKSRRRRSTRKRSRKRSNRKRSRKRSTRKRSRRKRSRRRSTRKRSRRRSRRR